MPGKSVAREGMLLVRGVLVRGFTVLACYKILSTIDAVEKDRFFIVGSEDLFRRKRCEDKLYFS